MTTEHNKLRFLKGHNTFVSMVNSCDRCQLSRINRKTPSSSEGDGYTMVWISEAPTKHESIFASKANQYLKKWITNKHLLHDSYFTQIIRCKPFLTKNPQQSEITACKPYLIDEFKHYRPIIIITLGLNVYNAVVGDNVEYINGIVNKPILINRTIPLHSSQHLPGKHTIIIPIYSPSYIMKSKLEEEYEKSFFIIGEFYRKLVNKFYHG